MNEFIFARPNGFFFDHRSDYHLYSYQVRTFRELAERLVCKKLGVKGDDSYTPRGTTSIVVGDLEYTFHHLLGECVVTVISSHWAPERRTRLRTMTFSEGYQYLRLGHFFQRCLSEVNWD